MSITTSFELYYQRALLCKIVEVSFWLVSIRAYSPPGISYLIEIVNIKSYPKNKTTSLNPFIIDLLIRRLFVHSPLLKKSIFVSLPPPSNMFKFGRFSYMTLSTTHKKKQLVIIFSNPLKKNCLCSVLSRNKMLFYLTIL